MAYMRHELDVLYFLPDHSWVAMCNVSDNDRDKENVKCGVSGAKQRWRQCQCPGRGQPGCATLRHSEMAPRDPGSCEQTTAATFQQHRALRSALLLTPGNLQSLCCCHRAARASIRNNIWVRATTTSSAEWRQPTTLASNATAARLRNPNSSDVIQLLLIFTVEQFSIFR